MGRGAALQTGSVNAAPRSKRLPRKPILSGQMPDISNVQGAGLAGDQALPAKAHRRQDRLLQVTRRYRASPIAGKTGSYDGCNAPTWASTHSARASTL